jgi:putative oxidoreductase
LHRLYSTFAGGWPGFGLLIMRLVIGAVLLVSTAPSLLDAPPPMALGSAPLAMSGLLLVAGLWTPVAGTVAAALTLWRILRLNEPALVGLLSVTIAAALAMLGPGRWSVDARLFGWRRIDAPLKNK